MIVIVPTRSRPHNVLPMVASFDETGAFADGVELYFVADRDDPDFGAYAVAVHDASLITGNERRVVTLLDADHHEQLVPKLNKAADYLRVTRRPKHIGFMGDDHRPLTRGWARMYREALDELGTGIVSCPDGYRPDDLPTQWMMTIDIVEALGGRMVPAPVEHLYCDDVIRDLGKAAECYRYLVGCVIEHVHPVAGKVATDAQYTRVNSQDQYRRDRSGYRTWKRDGGLARDAQTVVDLRTRKGTP